MLAETRQVVLQKCKLLGNFANMNSFSSSWKAFEFVSKKRFKNLAIQTFT